MRTLLGYIIIYISIMCGSIFFADKLKKKIESTIIINLLSIIVLLYIFGIFNLLYIGIWIIEILEILLGITTLVKYIKNKNIKELKEKIFTTGFVFFTIIYIIFIITTFYKELSNWDQFSYWSYAAKDMFNTNSLIITSGNIGAQYPPVPIVLEYFFMKILGTYSQGIEAFAMQLLGFSLIIPLFEKIKNGKIAKIAMSVITLCIPAIFSMLIFYQSSYPDALLGLFIGYTTYLIFYEKQNINYLKIALIMSLIVITLTKPIGIAISILIIIIKLIYDMINNKLENKKLLNFKIIKKIFILLAVVLITFISWKVFVKINPIENIVNTQNASEISNSRNNQSMISYITESVFKTTLGVGNESDNNAGNSNRNLIEKLYKTNAIYTPIEVSIAGTMCIYILICLYIYKYKLNNKNKEENQKEKQEENQNIKRKDFAIYTICMIIGFILYTLILQFAYLTQFSIKEMLAHDGMERYMATYLLGFLYFIVSSIVIYLYNKKEYKPIGYIILAAIIIAITPLQSVTDSTITSGIYNINEMEKCNNIGRILSNQIKEKVDKSKKILIICQSQKRKLNALAIRYYMYPTITADVANIYTKDNIEELDKIKNNYDYIYILNIDNLKNSELIKIEQFNSQQILGGI